MFIFTSQDCIFVEEAINDRYIYSYMIATVRSLHTIHDLIKGLFAVLGMYYSFFAKINGL